MYNRLICTLIKFCFFMFEDLCYIKYKLPST